MYLDPPNRQFDFGVLSLKFIDGRRARLLMSSLGVGRIDFSGDVHSVDWARGAGKNLSALKQKGGTASSP